MKRPFLIISILLTIGLLPGIPPVSADGELFQYTPEYLGVIKRDENGNIVAVSPTKQGQTQHEASPRVIRVGFDHDIHTPSAAAAIAKDGDVIEIEACIFAGDTAVWTQKNLTIRGIGGHAVIQAGGAVAANKAIWVFRGGNVRIENIDFLGAKARHDGAAGIRLEQGSLTVRSCRFMHNDYGILTADGDMRLDIENSEFGFNGKGDGGSLNIGRIDYLTLTGNYIHHAIAGPLVLSRSRENHIVYNRLTDEAGGRAGYEIDLPNAGLNLVVGNIIEKSATAVRPDFISLGTVGLHGEDSRIYIAYNTFLNDRHDGRLIAEHDGQARIATLNNVFVGRIGDLQSASPETMTDKAVFRGNWHALRTDFADTDRYDLRFLQGEQLARNPAAPAVIDGVDLTPRQQYRHPCGLVSVTSPVYPGAIQEGISR